VPRSVLSGFVDSILTNQSRRLKSDSVAHLSRREQEVLDSLLENLSNKEIASKLNIAERTVNFTSPICSINSEFAAAPTSSFLLSSAAWLPSPELSVG